mmetsp:Transcript_6508/g.8679  ORF Transcript_6508/g.8679 Transcript_6508/m.8679 type:complete len:85 (-) Transcript_6508:61-315(-)
MITYEVLTLQLPYGNFHLNEAILRIRKGVRPPVPPSVDGLPDSDSIELYSSVIDIFETCSVLKVEDRPSSSVLLQMIEEKLHTF